MSPVVALAALFAAYVLLVTWQMRRAVRTGEAGPRLREARRLLAVVSLGVPLLVALILIAV